MSLEYVLDLHTHTVVSGHAYCSLREMARTASEKGLKLLGITEHAPKMPGTCGTFYFQNLKAVPEELYGIPLFLGAELNILDPDGTVDLEEKVLRGLDVTIASLHLPCMKPGTIRENTMAYLNVMKNPFINIIGHPDDGRYPVDYRALAEGAKETGKILELNNHSLEENCARINTRENDLRMLELCREYRVPVILGSDAHYDLQIGEFAQASALLEEIDFPKELVLNRSVSALSGYLNREVPVN